MKKLEEVLKDWEAVIGLEVHAELTTLETKMFCGCKLEFGAAPNTHTCPVCLGLPGALPVPNKAAIESIVLAGLATNCDIEKRSMFYRKNYMYPDMSKNFQITQGPVAFCMRGHLDLEVDGAAAKERVDLKEAQEEGSYVAHIGIERIHMEEDAGKMVHIGGGEGRIAGATHSLIDYNRCGTPLIELVTQPDLRTPEEARLFMQKLRQIYLAIGISDCSMEEGSLRCDGNVSLRRRGATAFGTKTELKNMNSFKYLHDGLAYEICRQAEVLEEGGVIYQETRHWDPSAKRTIVMRVKETADDYRLFPEPDLAPYDLSDEFIEGVRAKLPELPDQKAARFAADFGLTSYDARHLVEHRATADFFDECMALAQAEADGSKRLPLKAHAAWEPVLPPERNRTVCVFGASALGQPIQDAAHRPELYAPLAETSPDAVITPAIAARVLAKEGGFDVLFINQADVLEDPAAALQPFADALTCPAIYGALAEGYWAKL